MYVCQCVRPFVRQSVRQSVRPSVRGETPNTVVPVQDEEGEERASSGTTGMYVRPSVRPLFPIHLNTYVMGLRQLEIFSLF